MLGTYIWIMGLQRHNQRPKIKDLEIRHCKEYASVGNLQKLMKD